MNTSDDRRGWHFDKTVGVAHIFTTLAAVVSAGVLLAQFDKRITVMEQAVVVQQQVEHRQDADSSEFKREMRELYRGINDKLDRLIERGR